MKEKQDKAKMEFSNLRSDVDLRAKAAKVICENPADKRALDLILGYDQLTAYQREWIKSLIKRQGKKFMESVTA